MVKTLKIFLLPFLAIVAITVACNKSDELTTEEAVDQALYSIQERGGMGRFGCYELVFPVTLTFSDGTTAEVNSYDEMKQALRTYFQTTSDRPHPNFVFPISVISQDGDLISVNDQEELRRLRADCRGTFDHHGPQGHGQHGLSCFQIVFPITIEFPDGTTAQASDRMELHQLIRTWRHDHPDVAARPKVVFPITVKMTDDDALVTVNSREELQDLKESCD